ncbi:MAG: restriction endonuclease [Parcubacteria group bacterium]
MAKRTLIDDLEKPTIVAVLLLLLFVWSKRGIKAALTTEILLLVVLAVLVIWVSRRLMKRKRSFLQSQDSLQKLRALHPDQFEDFIAELFRRLGYKTEIVGGVNDGGVDVVAEKDGIKHYVQCKKFIIRQVGVHDVRDFYAALVHRFSNARAFFITTNIFTLEAEKFCEDKSIELIDGNKLMEYVRQAGIPVPDTEHIERCPRCNGVLVHRNGKFGPFFGCSNFPKCTYTKGN